MYLGLHTQSDVNKLLTQKHCTKTYMSIAGLMITNLAIKGHMIMVSAATAAQLT